MPCTEVKSEKYQTRKSPPFHAKDCKNLTKKGKDGPYRSKADAKGIYKWVKGVPTAAKKGVKIRPGATKKATKATNPIKGKAYFIHDNGSKPYKVQVSGKTVEIYKGEYRRSLEDTKAIDYETMDYDKLIKKLTVKEIYIGKSPCIPAADWCGAPTVGNTILLHISGNKYIHIGHGIFEFSIDDEVDTYYSVVGNNDVPYPVILGTKNVYFMLDNAMMPREAFKAKMTAAEWADGYRYFYGMKDLETGEEINCSQGGKAANKCRQERSKKTEQIKKEYVKKFKVKTI